MVIVAIDREGRSMSQGSGFVVREDGAVVTNYHVISKATDIKMRSARRFSMSKGSFTSTSAISPSSR